MVNFLPPPLFVTVHFSVFSLNRAWWKIVRPIASERGDTVDHLLRAQLWSGSEAPHFATV